MRRKGITPVVAVVLLVFMTVAAAGGAFVFLQAVQEEFKKGALTTLRTDVDVIDLTCSGQWINATLQNNGEAAVDVEPVHVFVRHRSNGRLNNTLSATGINLGDDLDSGNGIEEPGDTGKYTVNTGSGNFQASQKYIIEYNFPGNEGHTARSFCTAE